MIHISVYACIMTKDGSFFILSSFELLSVDNDGCHVNCLIVAPRWLNAMLETSPYAICAFPPRPMTPCVEEDDIMEDD